MEKESFVFYRSFYEAICELPRDVQGEIYTAIMEYGLNGRETECLKPIARSIFMLIKPQIEANRQRYENGKKGGRPRKEKTDPKPNDNQTVTDPKPNVNVNDNVNDNVNENVNENVNASRFGPPTLADVVEYCKKRENRIDAQRFVNFYQAKGWMVGKNKMKDWRAAVRAWEQSEKVQAQPHALHAAQLVNDTRYEQF